MFSIIKCYRFINSLLEKVLFFEQNCVLCGCIINQQLCQDCYLALPWLKIQPRCPRCLVYLWPKEIHCANCSSNLFYFDRIICGFEYAFPLSKLLQSLKYQAKLDYSAILAHLFWRGIQAQLAQLPDMIIPVPLHLNKHKLRGFNQVTELLREFQHFYPAIEHLKASRIKDTLPQATLNKQQRIHNLDSAFNLEKTITGKHIAIVDDVVTTATTVNELARVCRARGAQKIDIWCLMRTQN